MIKALAIKELREVLWLGLLGFAAQVLVVAAAIGVEPLKGFFSNSYLVHVPFADNGLFFLFCLFGGVLAVALGFRQSAWDSGRGSYLFLLFRPIKRNAIFLVKLGVGLAVLLVCLAVPTLLYAWWALVPGTHPSPAEWSMTLWTWQFFFFCPFLYLCAFLSGLRPARWIGTRTLPVAATVAPAVFLLEFSWIWPLVLPGLLLVYAVLVANICYIGRMRDY
jgi:hypothetical protein